MFNNNPSNKKNFWKTRLYEWTSLDISDRVSEILFGLIMVLTFTGTISVSTNGQQDLNKLLWAALGCNFAWGLVDAIMYLMDEIVGRSRDIMQMKKIRSTNSTDASRELIRDVIPPLFADLMSDTDLDLLSEKVKQLPNPDIKNVLTFKDFVVAVQLFLLVFLSTFPVALPFLFINDASLAMRVSNGVALIFMFAGGYALAKYSGLKPFKTALIYAAIGMFLVSLTMMLGG